MTFFSSCILLTAVNTCVDVIRSVRFLLENSRLNSESIETDVYVFASLISRLMIVCDRIRFVLSYLIDFLDIQSIFNLI
jgi:hypothetical protein